MAEKVKAGAEHFQQAYEKTGDFFGALSETAEFMGMDWLANFIDKVKEMKDKIGEIPAKLKEWQEPLTMAAILVGALGLAVLAYWVAQNFALITTALGVGAITAWNAVCGIAAGITAVFGAAVAFLSSPITIAILAIGLLVAAGYWLYKNWDEVSAYLVELWNKIKAKAQEMLSKKRRKLFGIVLKSSSLTCGIALMKKQKLFGIVLKSSFLAYGIVLRKEQ